MSEHHQLEFNGQLIETDAKGYLLNSNDWSEALALVLAEQEGIVLEEPHWEVVRFVRAFYLEFNTSPPSAPWSRQWRSSTAREGQQPLPLQAVPGRPAKQATKIGGLPKPVKCI